MKQQMVLNYLGYYAKDVSWLSDNVFIIHDRLGIIKNHNSGIGYSIKLFGV